MSVLDECEGAAANPFELRDKGISSTHSNQHLNRATATKLCCRLWSSSTRHGESCDEVTKQFLPNTTGSKEEVSITRGENSRNGKSSQRVRKRSKIGDATTSS